MISKAKLLRSKILLRMLTAAVRKPKLGPLGLFTPFPTDYIYTPIVGSLLPSVDLRADAGPVEDQSAFNACTANSVVSACELILQANGVFRHLSRAFNYYESRDAEDQVLDNPGADAGAYLRLAISAAKQVGLPDEVTWPYPWDDILAAGRAWFLVNTITTLDAWAVENSLTLLEAINTLVYLGFLNPADYVNVKPSQPAYDEADLSKIDAYYRIYDGITWDWSTVPANGTYETITIGDSQYVSDVKSALNEKYPVIIGLQVTEQFRSGITGTLAAQSLSPYVGTTLGAPSIGGHAVVIVGYDDVYQSFIIENSWGSTWGDGGYALFPYTTMTDLYEAWVIEGFDGMTVPTVAPTTAAPTTTPTPTTAAPTTTTPTTAAPTTTPTPTTAAPTTTTPTPSPTPTSVLERDGMQEINVRRIDGLVPVYSNPDIGDLWYDVTADLLKVYTNNGTWVPVCVACGEYGPNPVTPGPTITPFPTDQLTTATPTLPPSTTLTPTPIVTVTTATPTVTATPTLTATPIPTLPPPTDTAETTATPTPTGTGTGTPTGTGGGGGDTTEPTTTPTAPPYVPVDQIKSFHLLNPHTYRGVYVSVRGLPIGSLPIGSIAFTSNSVVVASNGEVLFNHAVTWSLEGLGWRVYGIVQRIINGPGKVWTGGDHVTLVSGVKTEGWIGTYFEWMEPYQLGTFTVPADCIFPETPTPPANLIVGAGAPADETWNANWLAAQEQLKIRRRNLFESNSDAVIAAFKLGTVSTVWKNHFKTLPLRSAFTYRSNPLVVELDDVVISDSIVPDGGTRVLQRTANISYTLFSVTQEQLDALYATLEAGVTVIPVSVGMGIYDVTLSSVIVGTSTLISTPHYFRSDLNDVDIADFDYQVTITNWYLEPISLEWDELDYAPIGWDSPQPFDVKNPHSCNLPLPIVQLRNGTFQSGTRPDSAEGKLSNFLNLERTDPFYWQDKISSYAVAMPSESIVVSDTTPSIVKQYRKDVPTSYSNPLGLNESLAIHADVDLQDGAVMEVILHAPVVGGICYGIFWKPETTPTQTEIFGTATFTYNRAAAEFVFVEWRDAALGGGSVIINSVAYSNPATSSYPSYDNGVGVYDNAIIRYRDVRWDDVRATASAYVLSDFENAVIAATA